MRNMRIPWQGQMMLEHAEIARLRVASPTQDGARHSKKDCGLFCQGIWPEVLIPNTVRISLNGIYSWFAEHTQLSQGFGSKFFATIIVLIIL